VFEKSNYKMKDTYATKDLVIGKLQMINVLDKENKVKTTKQKYIFERIIKDNDTKYRELCTGIIVDLAEIKQEEPILPCIVELQEFDECFPELSGQPVNKLGLIWIANDINYEHKVKRMHKRDND